MKLGYEIRVDGARLKQVSEFKYLGCVLNESVTYDAERRRKVASERIIASTIRVVREGLIVPALLYGSEIMIWRQKEVSRIKSAQMGNLRSLLSVRKMDRVLNARINSSLVWRY